MNLALFDLDHTLLPLDSDYEWGQFLVRIGAVDAEAFAKRNAEFFAQYQAGTLDPVEYLEFALGTLAQFPRKQLDAWHRQGHAHEGMAGEKRQDYCQLPAQLFLQRFAKRHPAAVGGHRPGRHQSQRPAEGARTSAGLAHHYAIR
jgi:hypothetical protein